MNGTRRPGVAVVAVVVVLASACSYIPFIGSRSKSPTPTATPTTTAGGTPQTPGGGGQSSSRRGPRSYEQVITAEAETQDGLFRTHKVGDTLYFEIPRSELGKDLLLIRRTVAGTPGIASPPSRVVAWEYENERIVLRNRTFDIRAPEDSPLRTAVDALTFGSYIASFEVQAFGPDSSFVIDVTSLFTTNRGEFVGVRSIASDRTYIQRVTAYPTNINIVAVQTGVAPQEELGAGAPSVASTAVFEWSMLLLPEDPMMPRLYDSRVGYFTVQYTAYNDSSHRAETKEYIRRFRLEKKDPTAEISEPVKPIVFWIDRATPHWLIPWIIRGVEEWQPAFEAAGFRNAIVARIPPSPEQDPNWSPHDARNSVIFWRPSTTQNASGGHVADPRTGEILKAEVNMLHNVMNLLRNWYFVQAGPLDPRARRLPLPDSLMGRLVQHVVAHEVGHAIGFPHNFKASYTVPADSVRSVTFLRAMGSHTPTLMDYSRLNYVAQPEDNIPVELLIPKVGPYDHFAVMWGHKPIPGARTPEEELPTLDEWVRIQEQVPWLRYQTPDATNDPGNITEAVGDQDPVKSSTLALRNLERVMGMMLEAAERPGEDYSTLSELYGAAIEQWGHYMRHVAALIGGADSQERRGTGPRFFPVARERQVEAMEFLKQNAFYPPPYLLDLEILRRMEPAGAVTRIGNAQRAVINTLFSPGRLALLVEYEALSPEPGSTYTVADLARDARDGIWTELQDAEVRIDVFRRNLQRAHLAAVEAIVNNDSWSSDGRPILRGDLIQLDRDIAAAMARAADPPTRMHLEDARFRIARMLDPNAPAPQSVMAPPAVTTPTTGPGASRAYPIDLVVEDCFAPAVDPFDVGFGAGMF